MRVRSGVQSPPEAFSALSEGEVAGQWRYENAVRINLQRLSGKRNR